MNDKAIELLLRIIQYDCTKSILDGGVYSSRKVSIYGEAIRYLVELKILNVIFDDGITIIAELNKKEVKVK